jgi:prepilin-type N-terminal cleavage/methylation domain-containing protein
MATQGIYRRRDTRGFTLIEMLVSVAIFTVVMAVSTIALLSMVDASKKAHALQSVMFNLNVAVDGMVRSIRMGSDYRLTAGGTSGSSFEFCPFGRPNCFTSGHADEPYKIRYYWVNNIADANHQRIMKVYKPAGFGSSVTLPITASEVKITSLTFYLTGTTGTGDNTTPTNYQPRVMMIIRGTAGDQKVKTTTNFDIQASATQRLIDI